MAFLTQKIHKRNSVRHNNFDLSNNVNTLNAPGFLQPLRYDELLPGETYKFSTESFARTLQLTVPSFARVKAHIDSFFVPYRLLGTDYQNIIVQNNRGILANYTNGVYKEASPSLPYTSFKNLNEAIYTVNRDSAGLDARDTTTFLLNCLDFGINSYIKDYTMGVKPNKSPNNEIISSKKASLNVLTKSGNIDVSSMMCTNLLPLQCYQKIYQDYYRNQLWEKENKASYFLDSSFTGKEVSSEYLSTSGLVEMRYHDFEKDRITGMIPDENNILSSGVSLYAQDVFTGMSKGLDSVNSLGNGSVPSANTVIPNSNDVAKDTKTYSDSVDTISVLAPNTSNLGADYSAIIDRLSALSFRRLSAMQKFAEITDLNKSDYKHQIRAHFGFVPNELNSDYCTYIGGTDIPLNISDVECNNGTDDDTTNFLGYLAGKGSFFSVDRNFHTFKANEHGIIMHILYTLPEVDYLNVFTNRTLLKFSRYDFAIPEFDDFGFEPVRLLDIYNTIASQYPAIMLSENYDPYQILGYLPRYFDYKTKMDSNSAYSFTFSSNVPINVLNYNNYIVSFPYQRFIHCAQNGYLFNGLKCRPDILKDMFPVSPVKVTSDNQMTQDGTFIPSNMPFIFHVHFNVSVSRPLSRSEERR